MDFQAQALTDVFPWREAPRAEFAVIAESASHSLSPTMHNAAFRAVGLPQTRYVAINVPRGEVGDALQALASMEYVGVNVTVPHKSEARAWVQTFDSGEFSEVNVVNTVRLADSCGFNTDATGFRASILKYGLGQGHRGLVLGAGGAAPAVLAVLKRLGLDISIWNRTEARARELADLFGVGCQTEPWASPEGCHIVVNATSAGKFGEEPPVLWRLADPGCVAYDLYYAPGSTPFLISASEHGLSTQDGVELLVQQGAAAWLCWGIPAAPPVRQMESAVREALALHP